MVATLTALDQLHETFRHWLSDGYDLAAIDATVATAAAGQLGGDPLWLMLISGSGGAKTETVSSLLGVNAMLISTISSEAALLTATVPKKSTKDATGGILRQIGEKGLLVIKDFTSIMSMPWQTRSTVLSALREIHDGQWQRYVGVDGGRVLEWHGHLTIVAACTTAWDFAHAVVGSMGDRFILVRMDSENDDQRLLAAGQASRNLGHEQEMRAALQAAVRTVLAQAQPLNGFLLTNTEATYLNRLAMFVTRCRTAVEGNYRGEAVDSHASEHPGRFIKQLGQLLRGAISIGLPRHEAFTLVRRCAFDSIPPFRLALLQVLNGQGQQTVGTLAAWLNKIYSTTKNHLDALALLGLVCKDEVDEQDDQRVRRYYSLSAHVEQVLNAQLCD
jgi:hypothetical protein